MTAQDAQASSPASPGFVLSRWLWLLGWMVTVGVQLGLAGQVIDALNRQSDLGLPEAPPLDTLGVLCVFGLVLVQVLKVPLALGRLRDLARPSDDALWTLVPIMNVPLFFRLLGKRPKPELWARRTRVIAGMTSAFQAAGQGLQQIGAVWSKGLPVVAGIGVLAGVGADYLLRFLVALSADPTRAVAWAEGLQLVAGALGLYAAVYALRVMRGVAKRSDGLPLLFLAPTLALLASLSMQALSGGGMGIFLLVFLDSAVQMGWMAPLAGAAVYLQLKWLETEEGAERGSMADVITVYGFRFLIVSLGMQILLPGIWFAIAYAYSALLAFYAPTENAFWGSMAATQGYRNRILKLLAVWAVGGTLLSGVLQFVALGEGATATLFDPTLLPTWVSGVDAAIWFLNSWWCLYALRHLYLEQVVAQEASEAGAEPAGSPA